MEDAAWAAFTELASPIPDLMDVALTGTVDSITGKMANRYVPISYDITGSAVCVKFVAFNTTVGSMRHKLRKLVTRLHDASEGDLSVIVTEPYSESFWSFQKPKFLSSNFAGSSRITVSDSLDEPSYPTSPKKT